MNKVYHVKTQEDCNALMSELEKKGYVWWGSEEPATKIDFWWAYKEDTCVKLENKKLFCGSYDVFKELGKELGYEITEYKEPKKKEKKTMKLEDVFTSEIDIHGNIWLSQEFCTKAMQYNQNLYREALKLEASARNKRKLALKGLEKAVAEERKALLENVEQLDKALKESEE